MGVVFSATVPVFLLAALGFFAQRVLRPDVPGYIRLVLYFFVPFLVFHQVAGAGGGRMDLVRFAAAFALGYLFLYLGAQLLGRLLGLPRPAARTLLAAAIFPNSGNMGLSVALFALGEAGLERAVVYFLLATVVLFGLGPALFRGGGLAEGLLLTLRLPFVWALGLGVAFAWGGVGLPLFLERPVAMLAQAAIPMLLLGLGMQIAGTPFRFGGFELLASALRLVGGPLAAALAGRLLGLFGTDYAVLVLISGMPVAVNAYMLAAEFGGDAGLAARTVAVSTLASFLSIPAVLLWVG